MHLPTRDLWARRVGTVLLVVQGAGGLLWWVVMATVPALRPVFHPMQWGEASLAALAVPDLPLFCGLHFLAAWRLWVAPQSEWTQRLLWGLAGAVAYPAMLTVGEFAITGDAWGAVLVMVPAAFMVPLIAWSCRPGHSWFRVADEASATWNTVKSVAQMMVFWGLFLGLVPAVMRPLENALGVPSLYLPGQVLVGGVLFGVMGTLSLWSGLVMAMVGRGTPLPLDAARHLVVRGPYRWIRNPMAVTGLAMGAAQGIALGSPGLLVFAAAGVVVWDRFVRPIEEDDLRQRFGEPYERYCEQVRCWVPRLTPVNAQ